MCATMNSDNHSFTNRNFSKTLPFEISYKKMERQCKTDLQSETLLPMRWTDCCRNKLMFKDALLWFEVNLVINEMSKIKLEKEIFCTL